MTQIAGLLYYRRDYLPTATTTIIFLCTCANQRISYCLLRTALAQAHDMLRLLDCYTL